MNLLDVTKTENEEAAYRKNAEIVLQELKSLDGFNKILITQESFLVAINNGSACKKCFSVSVTDLENLSTKTYPFCVLAYLLGVLRKNGYVEVVPYRYSNGQFSSVFQKQGVL